MALCLLICHAGVAQICYPPAAAAAATKFLMSVPMQEDGDEIAISDDEVMVVDSSSPPPAYSIPVTNRLLRQTRSEPWQPVPRPIRLKSRSFFTASCFRGLP